MADDTTNSPETTPAPRRVDKQPDETLKMIPWEQIEVRAGFNVRNEDDEEEASIASLAENILEIGLRNRIKVKRKAGTKNSQPVYEVRAGHRRLAALSRIRMTNPELYALVPCVLTMGNTAKDEDDRDFLAEMIADAESRPLKSLEKVRWYERAKEHGVPQATIMRALKITTQQSYDNYAKAAELTEPTKELIAGGQIALAEAVALSRIEGPERTEAIAVAALAEKQAEADAEVNRLAEEARAAEAAAQTPAAKRAAAKAARDAAKAAEAAKKAAADGLKTGELRDRAASPTVKARADATAAAPSRTGKRGKGKGKTAPAPRANAQDGFGKEIGNAVRYVDQMLAAVAEGKTGLAQEHLISLAKWAFRMNRDFGYISPERAAAPTITCAPILAQVPLAVMPLFMKGLLVNMPTLPPGSPADALGELFAPRPEPAAAPAAEPATPAPEPEKAKPAVTRRVMPRPAAKAGKPGSAPAAKPKGGKAKPAAVKVAKKPKGRSGKAA